LLLSKGSVESARGDQPSSAVREDFCRSMVALKGKKSAPLFEFGFLKCGRTAILMKISLCCVRALSRRSPGNNNNNNNRQQRRAANLPCSARGVHRAHQPPTHTHYLYNNTMWLENSQVTVLIGVSALWAHVFIYLYIDTPLFSILSRTKRAHERAPHSLTLCD